MIIIGYPYSISTILVETKGGCEPIANKHGSSYVSFSKKQRPTWNLLLLLHCRHHHHY
jgi:hypothetical protein